MLKKVRYKPEPQSVLKTESGKPERTGGSYSKLSPAYVALSWTDFVFENRHTTSGTQCITEKG